LCIASYGPGEDFFTLKGLLCQALSKLGIRDPEFVPVQVTKTYHPGRCANILYQGRNVGMIGEFHPDVLERYGIAARGCGCECDFNALTELADTKRYYTPLPRYPSTARDIALLVDDAVQVADIEALIRKHGTELLEEVVLFDVYRGKQVPEGKKSVAFTLTYRAKDRTLTDQEVVEVHEGVLSSLREELNAVLREL
jgi:phenylalanyl-tRNA synthetase beta chain